MLAAPKALMSTGGATTETLAFEVLPVPPFVELTVTVLFFVPPVVPVTFSETMQAVPGASVAPARLAEEDPLPAVAVPEHVVLKFAGAETTSPAGKASVKATPASVEFTFGLLSVKVKLVELLSGTVEAPNAFVIAGGAIAVRLAVEVDCTPVPAAVEFNV